LSSLAALPRLAIAASDAGVRYWRSRRPTAPLTHLERAAAVLGDLFRLAGVRYDAQPFAERALALLSANWCAVTALASALVEDRRVEGERVEAIIDAA
jgi:hypothetical protein